MEGSAVLSRRGAARPRRAGSRAPFVQRYWAFLSYSHADAADADWLHAALEKFRVPPELVGRRTERFLIPKSLAPVFRDRSELAASKDLSQEIREAIECSRHLIVLCSPAAAQSRWVDEEIRTFKQLRPDGEVLAAILSGEPGAAEIPGREAEECFPPALKEKYDSRGRPTGEPAEPIAADLRDAADGRQTGLLKLIAGMLDLRLDDLVQREEQRRSRKMVLVTAASIAGMALTSTLAVTAIQARDEARDQRREAESLVGFMIGDLKDKLEPVGRLDALDAVGARVLAFYEKQNKADLSDEALAQRSKALTLMGDIAQRRGDLDGALRRYREGLAGTAEALRRDPDNPQRLFDHAQNVFYIGSIARQRGQATEAKRAFLQYKQLADEMTRLEPGDARWLMETNYANSALGVSLLEEGRAKEAAALFRTALATLQELIQRYPSNDDYKLSRVEKIAWLADADFASGQMKQALEGRRLQAALLESELRATPQNVELRQGYMAARRALGRLLVAMGDQEAGVAQLRFAIGEGEKLVRTEPDNADWQLLTTVTQIDLAKAYLLENRAGEAGQLLSIACDRAGQLAMKIADMESRKVQSDCTVQQARQQLVAGTPSAALLLAGEALSSTRGIKSDRAEDDSTRLAAVYKLIGDIHQRMGNGAQANAAWDRALAALPPGGSDHPKNMALRAELLEKLVQPAARPLRDRLRAIGYRNII